MPFTSGIFSRRMCVALGLTALTVILLTLLWYASDVLLLLFSSVLLAVFLRGVAHFLATHTALSQGWSLLITVLVLTLVTAAGIWLLAPSLAAQADQLSQSLAESIQQLSRRLGRYEWGKQLMRQTSGLGGISRNADLFSRVTGLFSTTFQILANSVLVAFIGLYLAIDPQLYLRGAISLFPVRLRRRMSEVVAEIGETLGHWLVGRVFLMVLNGGMTALGLWVLGTPLALTLGIIAGLLNFIPNIGPLIAGVPAVLIAWTQSPGQALAVLILYLVLQNLDGYVLTPLVQQRTVDLPPALTILAQLVLGTLAGSLGLLLATPLAAAVLVFVKRLYLEDVLGTPPQAAPPQFDESPKR